VGVSVITRYVAVKVLDVVPAWDSHQPSRFLLRTEAGFDVFIDVHMTHTNVPAQLRQYNDFSKVFSLLNLPKIHTLVSYDHTALRLKQLECKLRLVLKDGVEHLVQHMR
jgi:hypothetical protein